MSFIEPTNTDQIQKFLMDNGGIAVVFAYAVWCNPCVEIDSYLMKKHKETGIGLVKINVDKYPNLTKAYKIEKFPTYLVIHCHWDTVLDTHIGGGQNNVNKSFTTAINSKQLPCQYKKQAPVAVPKPGNGKTPEDVQQFLKKNKGLIVVDAYAKWCVPCKEISPYVDKKSEETGIPVLKFDVDESPELVSTYKVEKMPTYMVVKKQWNNVVETISGGGQHNVNDIFAKALSQK